MPQMLCAAALRLLTTGVQAEAACTKSHGLQQATGHRDVLEEMDELGLVGQRAVENRCGENTEHASTTATVRVRVWLHTPLLNSRLVSEFMFE